MKPKLARQSTRLKRTKALVRPFNPNFSATSLTKAKKSKPTNGKENPKKNPKPREGTEYAPHISLDFFTLDSVIPYSSIILAAAVPLRAQNLEAALASNFANVEPLLRRASRAAFM